MTIDRAGFISELQKGNIGASVHFIPVPLHPFFKARAAEPENKCPECFKLYPRLVSLPLYPSMTEEEVLYVADSVRQIAAKFDKTKVVVRTYQHRAGKARTAEWSAT